LDRIKEIDVRLDLEMGKYTVRRMEGEIDVKRRERSHD